jgi:Rrf2 family transcriptional regulator, cysteine metabolism repressor
MLEIGGAGEYGTQIMVYLARRYGQGLMSVTIISEELNISNRYVEQLISTLRKAGLVKSSRGAVGGYELARQPAKITLFEIVSSLESSESTKRSNIDESSVRDLWIMIQKKIHTSLNSITLEEMVKSTVQKKVK